MTEIRVKVLRYDAGSGAPAHFDSFPVPYWKGMRVLDLLRYVHENLDGNLAFRHMCRVGQCGGCAVMVDGVPCLACKTSVNPDRGEVVIEPLRSFPVIKDLVVRTERGRERVRAGLVQMPTAGSGHVPPASEDLAEVRGLRSCIECWACVAACPVVDALADEFRGPAALRAEAELSHGGRQPLDLVRAAIASGLYDCTTCESCWRVCPQEIRLPEKAIGRLRGLAVEKGLGPWPAHRTLTKSIGNYWNPWMAPRSQKAAWASGLSLPSRGADLFFAGCSASLLRPKIAADSLSCLRAAGVETAYLGREEPCCLSPLLRIGDKGTFERMARKNVETVRRAGAERLIVACAGCYKTWKEDYPRLIGDTGLEVLHISEVLDTALAAGRLIMNERAENRILLTYHDPCHLGRVMKIYEAPRRVLAAVPGMKLVEMRMNRQDAACCGSGGGVKTARPSLSLGIGAKRLLMAEETGAERVVSCCPWCEQNLDDCLLASASGLGRSVDLVEIVARALEEG